jgi:Zn finger protein HypA/HybF involved in hydrogenase expression
LDEYSGLCIDCTLAVAEGDFDYSLVREQEEFEQALSECPLGYEDEESPNEWCPNCGSEDYDIIPIFETETQSRCKCNECGYEWIVGR